MHALHWVDYLILAVIGLSMITGLFRGFVKELIALSVWIFAIWLAITYSSQIADMLRSYIHDKTVRTAVAFVVILIATLIAGALINTMISFLLHRSGLSSIDRLLGVAFGFIRGLFLVSLLMLVVKMTSLPYQQYSNQSKLYELFDPLVAWLYAYTPDVIKHMKVFDKDAQESDQMVFKADDGIVK